MTKVIKVSVYHDYEFYQHKWELREYSVTRKCWYVIHPNGSASRVSSYIAERYVKEGMLISDEEEGYEAYISRKYGDLYGT